MMAVVGISFGLFILRTGGKIIQSGVGCFDEISQVIQIFINHVCFCAFGGNMNQSSLHWFTLPNRDISLFMHINSTVLVEVSSKNLIVDGCFFFFLTHPEQKSPPTALFLAVLYSSTPSGPKMLQPWL